MILNPLSNKTLLPIRANFQFLYHNLESVTENSDLGAEVAENSSQKKIKDQVDGSSDVDCVQLEQGCYPVDCRVGVIVREPSFVRQDVRRINNVRPGAGIDQQRSNEGRRVEDENFPAEQY